MAEPHQRIETPEAGDLMESKAPWTPDREGGKPLSDALVETDRAIDGINAADGVMGAEIPMGMTPASIDRRAFAIIEPIGIVAAISAFNHPLNQSSIRRAGGACDLKPAHHAPFLAWSLWACSMRPGCRLSGVGFLPKPTSCQALATDPRIVS